MFLGNPILILGLIGLIGALVLIPWRMTAKTKEAKGAANGAVTLLVTLGVIWVLLGGIMGFNHMSVHAGCVKEKAAWNAKHAQGDLSKADQELETKFIARCNTIITRYAPATE